MKTKKIQFIVICFLIIALCAILGCNNSESPSNISETTEPTQDPIPTHNNESIDSLSFSEIAGAGFMENINNISGTAIFKEMTLDGSFDEYISNGLMELIGQLDYEKVKTDEKRVAVYLYQMSISNGETDYLIDIFYSQNGRFVVLNNKWEARGNDDEVTQITAILDTIKIRTAKNKLQEPEIIILSDEEVLEHFDELLQKSKTTIPTKINASRYYIPDEKLRIGHWDTDFSEIRGYKEVDITNEQLIPILSAIDTSLSNVNVVSEEEITNSDVLVFVLYRGFQLNINVDETSIYLRAQFYDKFYRIKINNKKLHGEYMNLFDSNANMIDFEDISETESISLFYVKEKDKKDYPENGRLSEIKITDEKVINKIVKAIKYSSTPTLTYPSRENADLLLHTINGDVFIKMKYPVSDDKEELEWILTEPTIIVEGYFWYECPELYEILNEHLS